MLLGLELRGKSINVSILFFASVDDIIIIFCRRNSLGIFRTEIAIVNTKNPAGLLRKKKIGVATNGSKIVDHGASCVHDLQAMAKYASR